MNMNEDFQRRVLILPQKSEKGNTRYWDNRIFNEICDTSNVSLSYRNNSIL